MPTKMLTRDEYRVLEESPRAARPTRPDELRMAAPRYAKRVRRLKLSVAVWGVWAILITAPGAEALVRSSPGPAP